MHRGRIPHRQTPVVLILFRDNLASGQYKLCDQVKQHALPFVLMTYLFETTVFYNQHKQGKMKTKRGLRGIWHLLLAVRHTVSLFDQGGPSNTCRRRIINHQSSNIPCILRSLRDEIIILLDQFLFYV